MAGNRADPVPGTSAESQLKVLALPLLDSSGSPVGRISLSPSGVGQGSGRWGADLLTVTPETAGSLLSPPCLWPQAKLSGHGGLRREHGPFEELGNVSRPPPF